MYMHACTGLCTRYGMDDPRINYSGQPYPSVGVKYRISPPPPTSPPPPPPTPPPRTEIQMENVQTDQQVVFIWWE